MKIDKDTRIYIAGCGGMLGDAVYHKFSHVATVKATDIDLNSEWLSYANVRDYQQMEESIRDFKPDIIMNLAALTDMEYCEQNQDEAWLTNALGAENIALIASALNAVCVYISTAGIFGGEQEFFNDFDNPNPLSYYAKSKYYGELITKQCVPRHYVIRAGWMMGGGIIKDKKFVNKIYKQIVAGQQPLNIVDDKLGTPTYTKDFANGIYTLLRSNLYGVYNQTCKGSCSRLDVATEFLRLLWLDKTIAINKVASEFFSKEYFAPRPRSEKLVSLKLDARGLNVMRDWQTCLAEYSQEFIADLQAQVNLPFRYVGSKG
jgi:dTDP-4-dehydrorhamnose reductase